MIIHDIIESLIRGLDGGLGRKMRYWYYKRRLGSCGTNVQIDPGVYLVNPQDIFIDEDVWIDRNVIIIAGKIGTSATAERSILASIPVPRGCVSIGKYSHIGIGTIIQGHGGVRLSAYCTTSPGCKIYSYSNDIRKCHKGTMTEAFYIVHPVHIGMNTWLGINTTVFGHEIGSNCFVKPNTIVTSNVPDNTIYGGMSPERRFE